jgi:sugar lactone lactonase YvrE
MKLTALLTILTFLAVSPARSQNSPNAATDWNAEAIKAYQAKDYKRFLEDEQRALQLDPANPRLLYNVACGESLQGNAKEAVHDLDQLLARKLDLGAENDNDFAAIHQTPEWHAFQSKLAELRKPVVHSEIAFKLADPNLVATTLAVDPATGDTYIASMRERKIIKRSKNGTVSDFIHQAQDGFYGGASLLIDSPHHLLYATTGAVPFMLDSRKEDYGRSGIFAFDLKSGKLARKILLPPDGKQHFLNTLVMDRKGNIYISDSLASGIYLLQSGSDHLEVFIPSNVFRASQGLAFSDDQRTLYVADFSNGLWAVDLASKDHRKIDPPGDVWLGGLDGLARVPDGFIAVQIGVKPERVLHLKLNSQEQKLASVEILEMNHPNYSEPIQGTVVGHSFLYVANSQLNLGDVKTGSFAADRAQPTVVLRLPL